MRKLILVVAAVASMSSTSCYADLILATSDASPAAAEQPKARTSHAVSHATDKASSRPRPTRSRYAASIISYTNIEGIDHCH